MRVLVTGHKGFIGKNLLKYLEDHTDWEVKGWEWKDTPYPTVEGNDWVIHLGAISSTTETDVDKVIQQNYDFSRWMFRACKTNFVNLQYSSSASVYGLSNNFAETAPVDPRTPYAWSKYLFDRWVQQQTSGRVVQGFRYFNVYGNHEEHKGSQASPVTQFRNQNPIKLFENSNEYLRDFVAVEDVCRIHVEFINQVTESGVWNVGTGKTTSFQQVADLISNEQEYIPMPPQLKNSYQRYTCADLTKLESTIGPQQWISIEEWLNS
jgi:ADP-L-glycero-D-manno-heptose 6-epimerase